MRTILISLAVACVCVTSASAQEPSAASPVTVESYYRLNWGTAAEWRRLYDKNEAPVLAELQRQGLIQSFAAERPFTHMAGGPRWDFRIRVTYRDPEAAVGLNGTFDRAEAEAVRRLFPNSAERETEQRQRAAMVEEHWDVIVVPHGD